MLDKIETITTEGEIAALLQVAMTDGAKAEEAKARITALGHALVDQTGHDELGDVMDRLVGLDPRHSKVRHDLLESAWESVGREGDEHWT